MRLSAGVEWALHCAVLLAALPPTGVLSGRALAEFHGISESYLLKQLQALTRTGVFASTPGPTGGYRLARPAVDITVLDIVEAIEGTESVFRCTDVRTRGTGRRRRRTCTACDVASTRRSCAPSLPGSRRCASRPLPTWLC